MCGSFHVWACLNRILAILCEMKCLKYTKNQSKNQQSDSQSLQPHCQVNEPVCLHVKLRRKALLFSCNADKLDYLRSQIIYLPGQILCLLQKLVRGFLRLLPANLIINCSLKKCGFGDMILNKNDALGAHSFQTMKVEISQFPASPEAKRVIDVHDARPL